MTPAGTRLLRDLVTGLLALMRLTDARRPARTGPGGRLIPLGEQDRRRWDRDALARGHRPAAVRAHLLERTGDVAGARAAYEEAAAATLNGAEREYLRERAASAGRDRPAGAAAPPRE